MIELARRSDMVASAEARLVKEKDYWEHEYGLNPKLVHRPHLDGQPGKPIFAYSIIRLKDRAAEPIVDVMTVAEIEDVRARSAAGRGGPWVTDWSEMARKTVLRRNMKYAPMSAEPVIRDALAKDSARDGGEDVIDVTGTEIVDHSPEVPKTRAAELKETLRGRKRVVQVEGPNGEDMTPPAASHEESPPETSKEVDENGYDLHGDPEPELKP
jgi:recombination protein RecT